MFSRFTLTMLLLATCTIANAKTTYSLPRINNAPNIDGEISHGEWDAAKTIELLYENDPGHSIKAPVKTIAYMMEDGENIYFAFKAYDPDTSKIRAFIQQRDGIFRDDFVGVIIDTFNDERRGYEFFVNPMGSQGDLTRDDTQQNEDSSWNTVWDSAGKVGDEGYVVEMSIPFRALRYAANLDIQTWGIEFLRIYPRDSRTVISDRKNDRKLDCSLCQSNKLTGMPQLKASSTNFDFTPTATYVKSDKRGITPGSEWEEVTNEVEFGADVRWAVTEDWILNATVNPDFSQVEADAGQLDINTTFSLFYPEARAFFLDGADYFRSMNRLVHTRNIADPDYGLKVSGKSDDYSLGLISASDESTSFLIPSSQGSYLVNLENQSSDILIARGQKDIGDKANVGLLMTRRSADEYKNDLIAIDGRYYFTDKDVLTYQYMHSDSENPASIRFNDDGDEILAATQADTALSLSYRHNEENYLIRASYNDFGKDFRADMGFVGQVDFKKLIIGGNYFWYGEQDSKWTRWGFNGDWDKTEDQSGQLLEQESEIYFSINGPMQFKYQAGFLKREKFYNGQYFNQNDVSMWAEIKPTIGLTLGNFMRKGDAIDYTHTQAARQTVINPYITWQMDKHFKISTDYTVQRLNVSGGELFSAELIDTRLAYQFDVRSRLSLTFQLTKIHKNLDLYASNKDANPDNNIHNERKRLGTQLIYSYKINPQTLLYIGYSDKARSNDEMHGLQKTNRSLFAKFSYLLQM